MLAAGRQICRGECPRPGDDLIESYRQSGRPDDFEQIVRRFAALVLCECRRVTGNMYDAEDASQLVFLALAMEIKSGVQIERPGAWLQRVARRQALKIVRSRGRRKRREDAVRRSELHIVDTDSAIDSAVVAGIIRDAIDQLPERYRLTVILHYFGGMSLELIAHELKISKQAVGTRLHRGRKMLGERLSKQGVRLDDRVLMSALAVLVPAAVVRSVVRSASSTTMTSAASIMPGAMAQLLHSITVATIQRPLRLAAMAATLTVGGTGLAMVVQQNFGALQNLNTKAAIGWFWHIVKNHVPQPGPLELLSSADAELSADLPPQTWTPTIEPLSTPTTDELTIFGSARALSPASNGPLAFAGDHPTPRPQAAPKRDFSPAQTQTTGSKKSFESTHPNLGIGAPLAARSVSVSPPQAAGLGTPEAPMRVATPASDVERATLPVGEHHLSSVDVAVAGTGELLLQADTRLETPQLRIGAGPKGNGTVINTGAGIDADRLIVGDAGTGAYHQQSGQLNVGQLVVGNQPDSQGEVHVDSGAIVVGRPNMTAGVAIGYYGSGRLYVGSQDSPGALHPASEVEAPLIVRATENARGLVQGWGVVNTGGELVNNGRVVADGFDRSRTLDLSGFASVSNTIDNAPEGDNGWYARRGGQLILPAIAIEPGTHSYTWGESPADPQIDLVNSLRFTVHDQPVATSLAITLRSLVAADSSDVHLPAELSVLSLWQFHALAFEPASVDVTVRYTAATATDFTVSDRSLALYASNSTGQWALANSLWLDANNKQIGGDFIGGVRFLLVATQSDSYTLTERTGQDLPGEVFRPVVPEPGGLMLWVGVVIFLRRRPQRDYR